MLYGLGLGEHVVAVSHECDHPPEVRDKPRVTRSRINDRRPSHEIDEAVRAMTASGAALYEINVPRLAALSPDLIVTQAQCDVCAVKYDDVVAAVRSTPGLAGARIVALNPNRLEEVFRDILRVAEAAGVPDRGEAYVAGLRRRVESVQSRALAARHRLETGATAETETGATAETETGAKAQETPGLHWLETSTTNPKVACIEWIAPLMLASNWMPDLVALAGGRCDLAQAGAHSRAIFWDEVRAWDPDVIVVAPCGFDLPRAADEARALFALEGWHDTAAVRNGRVFAADGNAYFNRSGPRLVDSLELLAALVHRAAFADFAELYREVWCNLPRSQAGREVGV